MGGPSLTARVKLGQVIIQSFDQEIPLLGEEQLSIYRKRYIDICGDEPLAAIEASDSQLTAPAFVVNNGLAPYTDFAVWGPHALRAERKMRFAQHFQDVTGKWRAVEFEKAPTM